MSATKQSVRRPIFSRVYPMMARAMDAGGMGDRRSTLLAGLAGRVLEVGSGDGANFAHYPATVERVLAIEPEAQLRALSQAATARAPVPVEVHAGTAELLPVADASVDAVVFAMVLCSVPNQSVQE